MEKNNFHSKNIFHQKNNSIEKIFLALKLILLEKEFPSKNNFQLEK